MKHHIYLKVCLPVKFHPCSGRGTMATQGGVVLFLAMISLLVMSLASVALIRSVNTNTDITGNLGFKRAATASADAGAEAAIAWLKTNVGNATLESNITAKGYLANAAAAGASKTGSAFWTDFSASGLCLKTGCASDDAGNRVAFIIQRLCTKTGPRPDAACAKDPSVTADGTDQSSLYLAVGESTAIYYRVIVQVIGARNATSYVQTVVSLQPQAINHYLTYIKY